VDSQGRDALKSSTESRERLLTEITTESLGSSKKDYSLSEKEKREATPKKSLALLGAKGIE